MKLVVGSTSSKELSMPVRLDLGQSDFKERFQQLLNMKRETDQDINDAVAAIIDNVKTNGDQALIDYTQRFDRFEVTAATMRISSEEIEAGFAACDPDTLAALNEARVRIEDFHKRQLPEDLRYTDEAGVSLGYKWTAVEAAGLYVPGGLAAYPSSLLMNAIPARVAGVGRVMITVPTPDGSLNPLVLAAAKICEIDEIYRVGGAQAVAAMAYGTESIASVNKIVGPGNAYVATAKRQVYGQVGIDSIAGPSEILVVADAGNDPAWIAADLLSQAEHDPVAQSILITDDSDFAEAVELAIESHLKQLAKADIASASWRDFGAVIVVSTLDQALPLVNALAPEHLEIATDNAEELAAKIRNAGAIFIGRHTPEAIGDYVAGPNHVLPTARSARFSSGLGVLDFMKRTSLISCDSDSLGRIGPAAVTLAEAEGLDAHALSVSIRLN
jgi:histidinol dehydrogenase